MASKGYWTERNRRTGQYRAGPKCDSCGRPTGDNYFTDEEVCGGSDGPGFYLCGRKSCAKQHEGLGIEQRRALYTLCRNALDTPSKK